MPGSHTIKTPPDYSDGVWGPSESGRVAPFLFDVEQDVAEEHNQQHHNNAHKEVVYIHITNPSR